MNSKRTPGLRQGTQTVLEREGRLIDVFAFSQRWVGAIDDTITVRIEAVIFSTLVMNLVWLGVG